MYFSPYNKCLDGQWSISSLCSICKNMLHPSLHVSWAACATSAYPLKVCHKTWVQEHQQPCIFHLLFDRCHKMVPQNPAGWLLAQFCLAIKTLNQGSCKWMIQCKLCLQPLRKTKWKNKTVQCGSDKYDCLNRKSIGSYNDNLYAPFVINTGLAPYLSCMSMCL